MQKIIFHFTSSDKMLQKNYFCLDGGSVVLHFLGTNVVAKTLHVSFLAGMMGPKMHIAAQLAVLISLELATISSALPATNLLAPVANSILAPVVLGAAVAPILSPDGTTAGQQRGPLIIEDKFGQIKDTVGEVSNDNPPQYVARVEHTDMSIEMQVLCRENI